MKRLYFIAGFFILAFIGAITAASYFMKRNKELLVYIFVGLSLLTFSGAIVAIIYITKKKDESFVRADPFVKVCPQKVTLGEIANSLNQGDGIPQDLEILYRDINNKQGTYNYTYEWLPPASSSTTIVNPKLIWTNVLGDKKCYCGQRDKMDNSFFVPCPTS